MDRHQKQVIAISVGILLLLIIATLTVFTRRDIVVRPSTEQPDILTAPSIAASKSNSPTWLRYTNNGFSLQYPPGWRAYEYNVGPEDSLVIFKRNESDSYPSLSISTALDPESISVKDSLYTSFGMSKIMSDFAGDTEYIYKGVIPGDPPVQETNFVIVHNQKIYTMSYHHTTTDTSKEDLDSLQGMAASFVFTGR